ncbi:hypothetical protein EDD85DRAFT_798515 [Armillaria nabsnona]|nr:hypothetical protein EDD85DRAFT_798515 [Armillaria nabsnona]
MARSYARHPIHLPPAGRDASFKFHGIGIELEQIVTPLVGDIKDDCASSTHWYTTRVKAQTSIIHKVDLAKGEIWIEIDRTSHQRFRTAGDVDVKFDLIEIIIAGELWVSKELEVISVVAIRIVLRKPVRVTVRYGSRCYCDESGFVVGAIGGKGADLKDGPVPGLTGETDKGRRIYKRVSKREKRGDSRQGRCRESSSTLRLKGAKLVSHHHRGLTSLEALSPSILLI